MIEDYVVAHDAHIRYLYLIQQGIQQKHKDTHILKGYAINEFAGRNKWYRLSRRSYPFSLASVGKRQSDGLGLSHYLPTELFDHPIHFKKDGHCIAVVGQPYCNGPCENKIAQAKDFANKYGLEVKVPPRDPHASIWNPGSTLFLVFTKPEIEMKWLPEQGIRPKAL